MIFHFRHIKGTGTVSPQGPPGTPGSRGKVYSRNNSSSYGMCSFTIFWIWKRLLLIPAALFWAELWTSSGLIMTSVLSQLIPSQTFKIESPIFSNFRNSDLRLQQWEMTQLLRPVREHMLSKCIYLIKKNPPWSSMKTREIILLSLGISFLLNISMLMIMWIMCMYIKWKNRTIFTANPSYFLLEQT